MADLLEKQNKLQISKTVWYDEKEPTFSDAIASVRLLLWQEINFSMSAEKDNIAKLFRGHLQLLQQALAWAA